MKNATWFLLIVIVIAGGIYALSRAKVAPPVLPPGSYVNKMLGISLQVPPVLKVKEFDSGVALQSSIFVNENMSGLPEKDKNHYFAISFEVKPVPLLPAIKQQSDFAFSQMFPEGTLESFAPAQDFSGAITAAGTAGYWYQEGVEGINTRYVFLPKNGIETLLITFSFIGDFLKPAIAEQEQKKIFGDTLASLKFL